MMYLYVILLLVAAEIVYLLLAKRFDFIAVKKETPGGNTRQVLKGAGIVFWVAALLYAVLQLGFSTLLIAFYPTMGTGIFWILLGVLVLAYLAKFRMLRVVKHLERQ